MDLGDLKKLLSLGRGIEMLDAVATAIGKSPPSQAAKPLTSVNPNLLKPTQDEWWRAADQVVTRLEEFRTTRGEVLASWDVPKGFEDYMNKMAKLLENQQSAMHGVAWQLDAIRKTLESGKQSAEERIGDTAFAVAAAIIGALIGAAFSGGTALGVGGGIVGGLIVALIGWLYTRSKQQDSQMKVQQGHLSGLKALVNQHTLNAIKPPPAPDLSTVKGFSSIHEPAGV